MAGSTPWNARCTGKAGGWSRFCSGRSCGPNFQPPAKPLTRANSTTPSASPSASSAACSEGEKTADTPLLHGRASHRSLGRRSGGPRSSPSTSPADETLKPARSIDFSPTRCQPSPRLCKFNRRLRCAAPRPAPLRRRRRRSRRQSRGHRRSDTEHLFHFPHRVRPSADRLQLNMSFQLRLSFQAKPSASSANRMSMTPSARPSAWSACAILAVTT